MPVAAARGYAFSPLRTVENAEESEEEEGENETCRRPMTVQSICRALYVWISDLLCVRGLLIVRIAQNLDNMLCGGCIFDEGVDDHTRVP